MAARVVVASGVFSNPAVWDTGVPQAGDTISWGGNYKVTQDAATPVLGTLTPNNGEWDCNGYTLTLSHFVYDATSTCRISGAGSIVLTASASTIPLRLTNANFNWAFIGSMSLTYAGASDRTYNFGTSRTLVNNLTVSAGGAGKCYLQCTTSLRTTGTVVVNGPKSVQLTSGATYITDTPWQLNSSANGAPIISGATLNGNLDTAGTGGSDAFADWTESVSGASTVTRDTVNQYAGNSCCRIDMDGSASAANIQQTVLTVGNRYKVSFWARAASGNPAIRTNASAGAVTWTLSTTWTQYTGYFTQTTNGLFALLTQVAGATIYIDSVTLEPSNAIECSASTAGSPAILVCLQGGNLQYDNLVLYPDSWQVSEHVYTPGFETLGAGGADIWTPWVENAGTGTVTNETTQVHGGAHAAKLLSGSSQNTYVRTLGSGGVVAVIPGKTYSYSFWTRGDGTNAGRYWIQDYTNNANIVALTTTGITGATYTQFSGTFTAPAGCYIVMFYLYGPAVNGGYAYFDDVSVRLATPDNWFAGANSVLSTGVAVPQGYLGWNAGVSFVYTQLEHLGRGIGRGLGQGVR